MFKLSVHYKLNPIWFIDQSQSFTLAEIGNDIDNRIESLTKDHVRLQGTVKHLQEKIQLMNEVKGLVKEANDNKLLAIKEAATHYKSMNGYVNEGTDLNELINKIEAIIIK